MSRTRWATLVVVALVAAGPVSIALAAEVTQLFGARESWYQYRGVEAIASTNDPDQIQQEVVGVLQWAAGPIGMKVGTTGSTADDPFLEMGPRKILTGGNTYARYPYYSWDTGPGADPLALSLTSRPLAPASYNKYSIYIVRDGFFEFRFCAWSSTTRDYTDCVPIYDVNMGRSSFNNVIVGGESLCTYVANGGCPIGYVNQTNNRFLEVADNRWYTYCYTSKLEKNAPSGTLSNGQIFASGRVSACGPGPQWNVLYR